MIVPAVSDGKGNHPVPAGHLIGRKNDVLSVPESGLFHDADAGRDDGLDSAFILGIDGDDKTILKGTGGRHDRFLRRAASEGGLSVRRGPFVPWLHCWIFDQSVTPRQPPQRSYIRLKDDLTSCVSRLIP